MTLKSILAIASGEPDDEMLLTAAARLAKRYGAKVTVVSAYPDPSADLVYFGSAFQRLPAEVLARLSEGERDQQRKLAETAANVAAREAMAKDALAVAARQLQPSLAVAAQCVVADLVLMSGAAARKGLSAVFAETLLSVRAPILLIKDAPAADFDNVAIAWDGSAQAGRAMRAAMPLLRQAKRVDILTNVEESEGDEARSIVPLQPYLEAHGVREIVQRDLVGKDVPASLIAAARKNGCQLLVGGGYGRPRLYELVLGGATQALVKAEGAPHVLLAH